MCYSNNQRASVVLSTRKASEQPFPGIMAFLAACYKMARVLFIRNITYLYSGWISPLIFTLVHDRLAPWVGRGM